MSHRSGSVIGRVVLWGSIAVILGGLVWGLVALNKSSAPTTTATTAPAVTASDHIRGVATAKAVLIEYSDLQCPACKAYQDILPQLTDKFGQDFALVYRHFPLRGTHQYADQAVQAAEAAHKQNAFWPMHDILFERQATWSASNDPKKLFGEYAKELGLNVDQFTKDYNSQAVKDINNAAYDAATKLGVNSTPTFFLNGKLINNPRTLEAFTTIIQDAISAAK